MIAQMLTAADFRNSAILLSAEVGYDMYRSFREQSAGAPNAGLAVAELSPRASTSLTSAHRQPMAVNAASN